VLTRFIPNTYEFYWNVSADELLAELQDTYEKFWTRRRMEKAQQLDLTPVQVSILASIVQKESNKEDEWSAIAGVYLNRLRMGMKLQADPTVAYLIKNRKVLRIYHGDLKTESDYNTYLNYGLPPGPICLPHVATLEAVLDAESHGYLYFCAKSDLSGYHVFARTYEQHKKYAAEYRRALNKQNIR
jgi:UPF0755 protein